MVRFGQTLTGAAQLTVHGADPNRSARPRVAQFVKAFRRAPVGECRFHARSQAVRRGLARNGTEGELTALGRAVFGLDALGGLVDES
jgi:hypothetical protein